MPLLNVPLRTPVFLRLLTLDWLETVVPTLQVWRLMGGGPQEKLGTVGELHGGWVCRRFDGDGWGRRSHMRVPSPVPARGLAWHPASAPSPQPLLAPANRCNAQFEDTIALLSTQMPIGGSDHESLLSIATHQQVQSQQL